MPSAEGRINHTELDAIEAKKVARQNHLAQPEPRAECGEETDRCDSEQVYEEDGE